MSILPRHYRRFMRNNPRFAQRFEQLGELCMTDGPLSAKCCELIKIGAAGALGLEGAVHAHVRRAREAGAHRDEIRHAVLLLTTTAGFPRMMAAMSWVEEELKKK